MSTKIESIDGLLPETMEMLNKSDEERLKFLKLKKWIPYPRANEILERMEELLKEPKSDRMPNLLIVGSSHNGKTSIARELLRRYPPTDGIHADPYPVAYVQTPPLPDEGRLYDGILERLMVPFKYRDNPSKKYNTILYYFSEINVRLLQVDEIHNILKGSIAKQGVVMNALKNLSNELMIPLVLIGTKDALRATSTDLQISSRFPAMILNKWKLNEDYVRLLASIEQLLPLREPSNLASKELAIEIFDKSERLIGEIIDLIKMAAERAIKTGSERITLKELKGCGYIKPSQRRVVSEVEDI